MLYVLEYVHYTPTFPAKFGENIRYDKIRRPNSFVINRLNGPYLFQFLKVRTIDKVA